jgi:hypothetical protein
VNAFVRRHLLRVFEQAAAEVDRDPGRPEVWHPSRVMIPAFSLSARGARSAARVLARHAIASQLLTAAAA